MALHKSKRELTEAQMSYDDWKLATPPEYETMGKSPFDQMLDDAEEEGAEAFHRGKFPKDNPYTADDALSTAWSDGWVRECDRMEDDPS